MRIKKVFIENFRSIKSLEFYPKGLCALVGANNTGKSNILRALNKILGQTWPTERSFSENDFYKLDKDRKIKIEIWIEEQDEDKNILEYRFSFKWEDDHYRLRLYRDNNEEYLNDEIRSKFAIIHLGVERKIAEYMPSNRWTLLGRILLDINEEFRRDQQKSQDFKERMAAIKNDLLSSVEDFEELVNIVEKEAAHQLNRNPDDISVDFDLYDPWNFYRTLQIIVSETGGLKLQASQMGMGLQSSLSIALLRAYAAIKKKNKAVILIEEPENFLHPQAQRHFYNTLRKLAYPDSSDETPPIQIIYCTHSGHFLNVEFFDEICLVRKETDGEDEETTVVTGVEIEFFLRDLEARHGVQASEQSFREHLRNAYNPGRNEGFFASKIVLVEGQTEAYSLPIYAKALGYDFDKNGVAIIDTSEKNEIDRLYRLYNEFKIPCYIIFDGDRGKTEDTSAQNRALLEMVGQVPQNFPPTTIHEKFAIFEVDYETTLKEEQPFYDDYDREAKSELGATGEEKKGMRARVVARKLVSRGQDEGEPQKYIPASIKSIIDDVKKVTWERSVLQSPAEVPEETYKLEGDIPF